MLVLSNSKKSFFILNNCTHSELVSCVGWTTPDEVYSSGDDHQVLKWSILNEESSSLAKLPEDVYPTDMHWCPKAPGAVKQKAASDVFALCSTDGTFLNRFGLLLEKHLL